MEIHKKEINMDWDTIDVRMGINSVHITPITRTQTGFFPRNDILYKDEVAVTGDNIGCIFFNIKTQKMIQSTIERTLIFTDKDGEWRPFLSFRRQYDFNPLYRFMDKENKKIYLVPHKFSVRDCDDRLII